MWRDASLSRRLLLAAGGFIAVAMVIAAVLIGFVLHRFVQGQIDQRLDTQIVFLSSMLRADKDGRISVAGNADGPPFERPHRGWYWQVQGPANTLRSASLDGDDIAPLALAERAAPPPRPREDREARPRPADGPGPDDEPLHFRIKQITVSGAPLTIVASAPRAALWGPLREAMTTLGISLGVLGLALVVAMLLQIRLGLRPLERLRRAVADVRRGVIERVPSRQPQEIQPLVAELNGLLDENAANLERARRHVANLAHGLKTPLATLAIAVSGRDPEAVQPLVTLMERRIRHHLGRARSAALSGPVRTQTLIAPRLVDLGEVLGKINAGKTVAFSLDVPSDCAVACEQQDFDEMAGNLMENGFEWARGKVGVQAVRDGRMVALSFEDDGAGLPATQRLQVLRPGERLDESAPGFGFGLSITSELAELYGGELRLGESALGGLRATLRLPAP
jgi:signal transduction histidine kinase